MKYKVKNKLEQQVKIGKILFEPNEEKILNFKPYSDKFIVEEIRSVEKENNCKEVHKQ